MFLLKKDVESTSKVIMNQSKINKFQTQAFQKKLEETENIFNHQAYSFQQGALKIKINLSVLTKFI